MMGWRTPYFRERLIEHLQLEVLMGRVTVEEFPTLDHPWEATLHTVVATGIFEADPVAIRDRARGTGMSPGTALEDLADELIRIHTPEGINGPSKA